MVYPRIPVPVIDGPWVNIYQPQPDVYRGMDTENYRNGLQYDAWLVNDFTIFRHEGIWHAFGITHPKPENFVDDFHYDPHTVHEAEYQLFHATYGGRIADAQDGCFAEGEKILYPQSRPGERPECHAPGHAIIDGKCHLICGPMEMRGYVSEDFVTWEQMGTFFTGGPGTRDPFVWYEDGEYTVIYVEADEQGYHLAYRTSSDFIHWSESRVLQRWVFTQDGSHESPSLCKHGDYYYLFWSIFDDQNGCYDERTFVYASKDLHDFDGKSPIAMIDGHAVEIISEDGEDYIVSVFYPRNGLSAAKLRWK